MRYASMVVMLACAITPALSQERKGKDFIAKNGMTWPQHHDGGFTGPISKMFGVQGAGPLSTRPHPISESCPGERMGEARVQAFQIRVARVTVALET